MAPTAWATLNKTSREAWPVRTFFKASDVKGKWDPPEITSPKRRKGTTRLKSRIKANINVQTRIKSIMCVFEKKSHQVWIEATYCCFCVILMFWLGFLALTWISNVFPNMLYETKQYWSGNKREPTSPIHNIMGVIIKNICTLSLFLRALYRTILIQSEFPIRNPFSENKSMVPYYHDLHHIYSPTLRNFYLLGCNN